MRNTSDENDIHGAILPVRSIVESITVVITLRLALVASVSAAMVDMANIWVFITRT